MAESVRGIQAARRATVQVWDASKEDEYRGQGLLLDLEGEGAVVLTCHHVIAPVEKENLHVRIPQEDGSLGDPLPIRYDEEHSRPGMDAAVLSIDGVRADERPLLHRMSLERYNGQLPATVLIQMEPYSFDTIVRASGSLEVPAGARGDWPASPDRYKVRAFRLARAGITKPGVSGGVAICEEGVLGLVHFSRPETPDQEREGYLVPLTVWAEEWPSLDDLIEPLIDQNLRNAAKAHPVRELEIGTDVVIANYRPDLYIERESDRRACDALKQRGGVLIVGKPKSGKTRLAWQLLQDRPKALVIIPVKGSARPPATFERSGLVGSDTVLFFDDLHDVAEVADPIEWRRQLEDASGRRCFLICTSRDGEDWNLLSDSQGPLLRELGADAIVFTSESGEPGREEGENLSRDQGRRLANALAMTMERFDSRFDGTPGSLLLDLEDMGRRYNALRKEERDGVSMSRLLDSSKLLDECNYPVLSTEMLRTVAQEIRGNRRISSETWDMLLRRTQEQGFGRFDEFGNLQTYRPYLEECVSYVPREEEIDAFVTLLSRARNWISLLLLAVRSTARGKYERVLYVCDELISLRPYFDAPWVQRARALTEMGHFEEALEASEKAISLDGSNLYSAWDERALTLTYMSRREEALEAIEKAISLNPEIAFAWARKAAILETLGRTEEALEASEKAISFDSEIPLIWATRAAALVDLGRYEEALEANEKAISLDPEIGPTGAIKAAILFDLGRYEEALEASERAISLNPEEALAWSTREKALRNMGRYEEALEANGRGMSLGKHNDPLTWLRRSMILEDLERDGEALEALEKSLSLDPENSLAWQVKGMRLAEIDLYEEALKAYNQASRLASKNPDIAYARGTILLSLGRYEEALEAYEIAINLQPDDADSWHDKGVVLRELGRIQEALEAYERALRLEPDWPWAWYNKALALAGMDRRDEAAKWLCQVWRVKEQVPDLAREVAKILEEWGQDPEECESQEGKIIP